MTNHSLRTLAEAEALKRVNRMEIVDGKEAVGFRNGFIAGRTSAANEIEAERLDTDWEALGADAYINGLIESEEIARKGRDV